MPPHTPAERGVASVVELHAALGEADVDRVVLAAHGSPYVLDRELALTRNVTLVAEVNATVVLDAGADDSWHRRVLSVSADACVELFGLQLTGGLTVVGGGVAGGAIGNAGKLAMHGCEVYANCAHFGGGIFNQGELELFSCVLRDNTADDSGGAIYSYPGTWLSMHGCSVFRNTAVWGGAIDSHAWGIMMDSSVHLNTAAGAAGAVNASTSRTNSYAVLYTPDPQIPVAVGRIWEIYAAGSSRYI